MYLWTTIIPNFLLQYLSLYDYIPVYSNWKEQQPHYLLENLDLDLPKAIESKLE